MLTYKECNARQKKAWKNIKYAATDYIFGMMNGCLDNSPDTDEYKSCLATIKDIELLKEVVYKEATTAIYEEGSCHFGRGAEAYLKDIRFCGKKFLMEVVEHYCKKYQAEALDELGEEI